jgi:glutathione S-transferase
MSTPTLVIGNKNYSSWSLRAWLFLHASGVAFEERRIPLDTPGFKAEIADLSPTGCVPVLLDGPTRVWEALAICEYVNELHGLAGWPSETGARGLALAICHEMHAGFAALREELPMNCRARRAGVTPSAKARSDIERLLSIWADCRGRYGDTGPYLFGDFGIADAMYAPVVMRCLTYGVELPPLCADYAATVVAHPSVQAWIGAAKAESETIDHEERGVDLAG